VLCCQSISSLPTFLPVWYVRKPYIRILSP
jgi:hypothetical protein